MSSRDCIRRCDLTKFSIHVWIGRRQRSSGRRIFPRNRVFSYTGKDGIILESASAEDKKKPMIFWLNRVIFCQQEVNYCLTPHFLTGDGACGGTCGCNLTIG